MTLDLSRWQFGITTVFHFMFVPLTIGLALLLAIMQSAAYRTRGDAVRHDKWDHMTRFWRRLFLINFAVGVVTGIVQEFQFGMNWSVYSRYVGSVFGAPLAVEALLAFFLESTFLGVWIFGKGRVSARVHLASIWIVSIGTMLSALFILAANAWMQHPVGYKVVGNRAVMTNFWAVMTNSTLIGSFLHVLFSALVTSTMLILGVSAWHLLKDRRAGHAPQQVFATSARLAVVVGIVAIVATMFFGDNQARIMERQQPMKMAAAEAIYNTQNGASFSLLTIGNLSGNPVFQIRLPHMLSVLADNNWDGSVQGINQIQAKEVAKYGPGELQTHLVGHLLDFPDHGGMRHPHGPLACRRPLAHAPAAAGTVGLVPAHLSPGHSPSFYRQHDRLDLHRDGPSAVGRLRTAQDLTSRLTHRHGLRRDNADRLHGHLQPARRDRLRAHGSLCPWRRRDGRT